MTFSVEKSIIDGHEEKVLVFRDEQKYISCSLDDYENICYFFISVMLTFITQAYRDKKVPYFLEDAKNADDVVRAIVETIRQNVEEDETFYDSIENFFESLDTSESSE